MNSDILFIMIATFGSFCQEILHWFELRNKLEEEEVKVLIKSKYYWIISILMIVISGLGTWILFYEPNIKKSIPFILGASFPLIFKKAVEAAQRRDLGDARLTNENLSFKKVIKQYLK